MFSCAFAQFRVVQRRGRRIILLLGRAENYCSVIFQDAQSKRSKQIRLLLSFYKRTIRIVSKIYNKCVICNWLSKKICLVLEKTDVKVKVAR